MAESVHFFGIISKFFWIWKPMDAEGLQMDAECLETADAEGLEPVDAEG